MGHKDRNRVHGKDYRAHKVRTGHSMAHMDYSMVHNFVDRTVHSTGRKDRNKVCKAHSTNHRVHKMDHKVHNKGRRDHMDHTDRSTPFLKFFQR
ncbi:unnamed protein product [Parnassius apollo]|uniref:(apollo) hypothetical protein n=1 Tax=Parnassius apollo TaxID=110799 RepID=A0A8S3XNB4_PARAO|nr:unnamed protein product [Parnassius apollo]